MLVRDRLGGGTLGCGGSFWLGFLARCWWLLRRWLSRWSRCRPTDGPGGLSHFDLARKDCIGTARNTTSRVWFTLADGVLSDVYYPTLDNTNVETMQYIVTDGATFTDLQTRDMTYTVTATDARSLSCEVTTWPSPASTRSSASTSPIPTIRPC